MGSLSSPIYPKQPGAQMYFPSFLSGSKSLVTWATKSWLVNDRILIQCLRRIPLELGSNYHFQHKPNNQSLSMDQILWSLCVQGRVNRFIFMKVLGGNVACSKNVGTVGVADEMIQVDTAQVRNKTHACTHTMLITWEWSSVKKKYSTQNENRNLEGLFATIRVEAYVYVDRVWW